MTQLSSLLRVKNQINSHPREQVDRSHSWLRKKGADIQNIYDKIQKRDVSL